MVTMDSRDDDDIFRSESPNTNDNVSNEKCIIRFYFSRLVDKLCSLENENSELKAELLRASTTKSNLELKLQKQKTTHQTLMSRIQELKKIKKKL